MQLGGIFCCCCCLFFVEDVHLVEFMFPVFIHMPGGVTRGDSDLCCSAPCLLGALNSLCLWILHRCLRSHSVSDYMVPTGFSPSPLCEKCVYIPT